LPEQEILQDGEELLDALATLREDVARADGTSLGASGQDAALDNLAHYLALRRHDIRPLQRALMWRGLSSLGRLESRVLPTLDATLAALAATLGRSGQWTSPDPAGFFAGERRLEVATNRLFGVPGARRYTRIMVTLPSEAASDPALVETYVTSGMDVARINCAHDTPAAWRAMAVNVRASAARSGRQISVLMDIAGPKIRTEAVLPEKGGRIFAGDAIRLVADGDPCVDEAAPFSAAVSLPEIVTRLSPGDRVLYDDGKLQGRVERIDGRQAIVRIERAKGSGAKLKPHKGLNLPDTALGLSPLTGKDDEDIATVVECADMLGYSFVSRPEDIDLLDAALARHGGKPTLGLVAKVERPEAVSNLPALIARAAQGRPLGVMIARGDLAAEIGFERMAEMQEELLWLCEAAAVPVIWATQVLEGMVVDGIPSRGEMTDAAMSARAECVMLNKGPNLPAAVAMLDRLLDRMDDHLLKKTPTLRALKSW
jgi:pyruvate kinase